MEKDILYDCALKIILDKDKDVRKEGKDIITAIFKVLGREYIDNKIEIMKPILQDKMKKISKRVFQESIFQNLEDFQREKKVSRDTHRVNRKINE